MKVEEFKQKTPIASVLEGRGFKIPAGTKANIRCPFHKDNVPSFTIDAEKGLWHCHAGCGGGSVIDLLAKFDGSTSDDAIRKYVPVDTQKPMPAPSGTPTKIYSYQDENGNELYQVLRYVPKTFRQRHKRGNDWVWSMDGVRRVLYHLPEILNAKQVWKVEGEKDADALRELGFVATCNVGGAGKWMDSYTETLAGKEVVLCGDNDEAGRKHIERVFESISGKVKNAREVKLPPDFKDVSDYIVALKGEAKAALESLAQAAPVYVQGVHLPIKSVAEMEDTYREYIRTLKENQLDLSNWLPSLRGKVRGLVPGELVTIVAGTGVGKTALIQNLSKHAAPLPTILFELELPEELIYERYLGIHAGWSEQTIRLAFEDSIRVQERLGELPNLKHVYVCTESRLTTAQLEKYINLAELKMGQRPKLVLLDYIQLVQGKGKSRYERISSIAEELKIIAKACRVILVIASQVTRPDGDDPEVGLYDAKESGSIENSSGLVIGVWRDQDDKSMMYLKVLKNTKGMAGGEPIKCQFKGESMQISEMPNEPIVYGKNFHND